MSKKKRNKGGNGSNSQPQTMGKAKRSRLAKAERKAQAKPIDQKVSPDEQTALRWCKARGLFLLLNNQGQSRNWVVYLASTGQELGSYYPADKSFSLGAFSTKRYKTNNWQAALAKITQHLFPEA